MLEIPEPEGPCVPELYPYPSNHSCYLYVPVGHYKCDCRMDYGVEPEGMELEYNGYRVRNSITKCCGIFLACQLSQRFSTASACSTVVLIPCGRILQGDKCSACVWTNYQCHSTIVYVISAGLSVIALCAACYKQSGRGSSS